ncbi:MAG: TRAP transporter substrate-binding protein DctP [Candidatus Rokubacteria bacterium]|nr:TRAP transporter substrate-binding protein DctP [Candidatus Rokubacteria bacterium]
MTRRSSFRATALMFALLLLPGGTAAAAVKWDYYLFVGITHPIGQYAKEFAEEVKKRTNGVLEIVVRPAGELPYKATEVVRVTGQGQVQLSDGYQGFIAGDNKIGALPGLPFLVTTAPELKRTMEVLEPYVVKEMDKFGTTILFWYTWPEQNVWGRGEPITTIAGFKGRKIRATSPEQTEMLRRFGAIPVTFTTPEVPAAAQRGAMEGILTAGFNLLGAKWYEFTEWGFLGDIHIGGPSYIIVNRKALESLPPDVRRVLQMVAREFHERMLREIPAREEQDRKTLETAHKIRLLRPAPAEVDKGRKLMEPYWGEWAQARGPEAVEALQKVRKILGR